MSTYEELKGLKVKYLSSDTSGDRIQEGEIFYNSTGFALKSFVAKKWEKNIIFLKNKRFNISSTMIRNKLSN